MKNKIIDYFSSLVPLTAIEKEAILNDIHIENFKKGTIILREGQVQDDTYFVLEGCIRQYVLKDGEEKTTNFFTEGQWVLSANMSFEKKPSSSYLSSLEDSTVIVGNDKKGDALLMKFPKFQDLSRMVLEKQISNQQEMMASFITDSPELRYKKMIKMRPDLLKRVPQYQLASFLGIKPESLSRIRKRLSQNRS